MELVKGVGKERCSRGAGGESSSSALLLEDCVKDRRHCSESLVLGATSERK